MTSLAFDTSPPPTLGEPASNNRVWAQHEWRLRIGDVNRSAASGDTYQSISPSTEEVLAQVPDAGGTDIDAMVDAAKTAQREWQASEIRDRTDLLRHVAGVLRANATELAALDAFDVGHPVTAMRGDVELAAGLHELFADLGSHLGGDTVPGPDRLSFTERVPYGVVARIVAYNHPLMFTASRLAAPLLAGNAVIVKAPDPAPLSSLRLAELLAGVVPDGLVGIVSGNGPVTGRAIVRHPEVRRIGFIGSVATGRAIQRDAADSGVKSVSLELGGKNAMIICDDVDPTEAAASAVRGMNFRWTAGQSCGSTSRLLVHQSRYREVVDRVVDAVAHIRVGDPLDPETEMGPLISAAHRDRTAALVDRAVAAGARVAAGGAVPRGGVFDRGFWYLPTVVTDVEPGSELEQTEVFGPVLAILPFADDDEAIRIANNTPYGLTAAVYSHDLTRALTLARRVEAGYVWVNSSSAHVWGTSFGGVKDSGVGREEGLDELLSYTQVKTTNVALSGGTRS